MAKTKSRSTKRVGKGATAPPNCKPRFSLEQRALRNPVLATAGAVGVLVTLGAEPAPLSFVVGCVAHCLTDEERRRLEVACQLMLGACTSESEDEVAR